MNRLALATVALSLVAAACGSHTQHTRYDDEPRRDNLSAPASDANSGSTSSNTGSTSSNTSSTTGSSSSSSSGSSSSNSGSSSSNTGSSSSSNPDPTPSEPPAAVVPAWHTVVDREMPYFECTAADQSTFEIEMTTTDAVVWFPDNSSVDGSVAIDASDNITFALGSYLNGPATNAVFSEDMLLTFDVGATHCAAFAYEFDDGFDASYAVYSWDDDLDGEGSTQWTLSLNQFGGASAVEELYIAFDDSTSYDNYHGVYFIDQGTIHVALINSFDLDGTVDAQHDISTFNDYLTPSSN